MALFLEGWSLHRGWFVFSLFSSPEEPLVVKVKAFLMEHGCCLGFQKLYHSIGVVVAWVAFLLFVLRDGFKTSVLINSNKLQGNENINKGSFVVCGPFSLPCSICLALSWWKITLMISAFKRGRGSIAVGVAQNSVQYVFRVTSNSKLGCLIIW